MCEAVCPCLGVASGITLSLSLSCNQEMAMDCATLTRHSVTYLLAKLDSRPKHPVYTADTVSIYAKSKYKSINPGF